ncbi:UvrD-helicase domain-containing protein [Haloferax volcanii]|uniref:UvrD-helicase domain-containing protein n=1 Tax=Haloferax volcanii TaxID=2246 RepID=UPI0023D9CF86|nr:UvrD-helicase domain-containing protein [Haloferax lucentense]WEL28043.1 ATP-dependent helicase/nuclease subunit A [Haloferax lucentense]
MERDELTDQQKQAVQTIDENYPLTAGAGTGKTTTLSFRYLELLEQNEELLPENILVTTFTRRAARELTAKVRERVLTRLAEADSATDYERWRDVLIGLEDAYIHTLHAFCQRVLSEHATAVDGLDPGFDTLDDVEATRLRSDVVDDILSDRPPAVEQALPAFSEYTLREALLDLLGKRPLSEQWASYWSAPERTTDEYVEYVERVLHPFPVNELVSRLDDEDLRADVTELRELLDNLLSSPSGKRTRYAVTLRDLFDELEGVVDNEAYERVLEVCDTLTTSSGGLRANYTPTNGDWNGDDVGQERVGELVESILRSLGVPELTEADIDTSVDRETAQYVFALARLLNEVAQEYRSRLRERNATDYAGLVERTSRLLDKEAGVEDVRISLGEQFDYVMIDEVQDTDPSQWDIVQSLTSLADETPYGGRNVFVVGDEKQSIYRFRNADVSVFEAARRNLTEANHTDETATEGRYELQDNFRSLDPVLRFTNALFEEVFQRGPDADFEAEPQALAPNRDHDGDVDPVVEYLLVPDDELAVDLLPEEHPFREDGGDERRWNEARAVASRITHLVEGETKVYDPDPEDGVDPPHDRLASYDDVAVIIRKRTHLGAFKRAFDETGIPYTVVNGEGYFDTPEVRTLLNLFRVLADPEDDIALYGLLRSPMFGFTDDELAPGSVGGDIWQSLEGVTTGEFAKARELIEDLRHLVGSTDDAAGPQVDSWTEALDAALDATGYLSSISADNRPSQAAANVERFRELLREGVGSAQSVGEIVERLEERQELSTHDPEASIPDGADGVSVLTVHAAKGEEYPIVVVPGISDAFNTSAPVAGGTEFERIDDRPALGLSVPDPEEPFDSIDTVAKQGIRRLRRQRLVAEEKRTLYVACTRARDHLVLAGTHGGSDGKLNEADPEDPKSWRDFVQQPLLGHDDLLATLGTEGTFEGQLARDPLDSEQEPPTFRASLPRPPLNVAERTDAVADAPTAPDVETPPEKPLTYRLSPFQVADILKENPNGELAYDERDQTVYYRRPDDEAEAEESEEWRERDEFDDESTRDTLSGMPFGEAVHRIAELRLPEERWDEIIDDALRTQEYDHEITAEDRERVARHAQRCIAHVDDVSGEDGSVYREFPASVELAHGTISGLIDCLVVDEDLTIVDYKTGRVTERSVEKRATQYGPQLEAYALMTHEFDPDRPVKTQLYFSELDAVSERSFTTGDGSDSLSVLRTSLNERIRSVIEARLDVSWE